MNIDDYKTPRSDAAEINDAELYDEGYLPSGMVRIDVARRLERELAACREALVKLNAAITDRLSEPLDESPESGIRVRSLFEAARCADAVLDATK